MRRMYSLEQLKGIISEVLGIDITKENPVKIYDGSFNSSEYPSITLTASYIKVVRNFNELQFIFNCRLTNGTESAITLTNDTVIATFNVNDEEVQNKIYAHAGTQCSTSSDVSAGSIAYASLFISETTGTAQTSLMPRYVNLYHVSGSLRFYLEGGNFSIGASSSMDLEARISLAL